MSETKPNPIVRVLPSLTDLAFLMPLVFLFVRMDGVKFLLGDGDTGYHIRAGEWMLANGRVPDHDIFSFTRAGKSWFAWEWLWDVTFAWLHQHGGLAAVVLVSMVIISLTFALLFRLVRRKSGNVIVGIAVTLLAMMCSTIHWLARPHLFTMLFLVIFLSLLERVREGHTRLLFWLPPLTVLWTNLHGGFFVGVIVVLSYAAGELTSWLVEADAGERRAALARSKPYLATGVGCAVASFINPYTWHLHAHILQYFTETYHFKNITEFQSISFHNSIGQYFEVMLFLSAITVIWAVARRRFVGPVLILGFAHTALLSGRNIPIFAITAAPFVAAALDEMLDALSSARMAGWLHRGIASFRETASEFGEMESIGRVHAISVLTMGFIALLLFAPAPPKMARAEYDPEHYPAKAIEMLRGPEFAKSVFTDDEWGDYLIYRLYPKTKVFVDGRSDFYGAKFSEQYLDILNVKYDWQQRLDRYGVNTVLLPVNAPLAGALKESNRWRSVYDDGVAIVFRSIEARGPASPVRVARSDRSSAADCSGGFFRGRRAAVTENTEKSDPRITKSTTRSEPL